MQILHAKLSKNPCTLCSAIAYCCGAVAPRAIAALLGRFLPRLGPLAIRKRPFFLFGYRFPGGMQRPLCRFAEPGPQQTPATATAALPSAPLRKCCAIARRRRVNALLALRPGHGEALFRCGLE